MAPYTADIGLAVVLAPRRLPVMAPNVHTHRKRKGPPAKGTLPCNGPARRNGAGLPGLGEAMARYTPLTQLAR